MKVDLNNLLEQAKEMQSKMQSAQAELAKILVTGEAGGGLVRITMDGRHTVKSIYLDPTLIKGDKDLKKDEELKQCLEELLIAAFNSALQKIEQFSRQKLTTLTETMQAKFGDSTES